MRIKITVGDTTTFDEELPPNARELAMAMPPLSPGDRITTEHEFLFGSVMDLYSPSAVPLANRIREELVKEENK